jgi:hypothetical protein
MANRIPCIPTTKVNSKVVLAAVHKRLRLLDETYQVGADRGWVCEL